MNENPETVELTFVPIAKIQDVLLARSAGRALAGKLGFPPTLLTRVSTAISEISRNVVQHSGSSGEVRLEKVTAGQRAGLRIVVADQGKGIEHLDQFLERDRAGALGSGLAGTRRLMHKFEIRSAPGVGTTVTMDLWREAGAS